MKTEQLDRLIKEWKYSDNMTVPKVEKLIDAMIEEREIFHAKIGNLEFRIKDVQAELQVLKGSLSA